MSLKRTIAFQFIVQIFGILSGFIISVLTARALGASGRGELADFSASLTFLVFFLGLGVDYSILSHIANRKFDQVKILNTALLLNLLFLFAGVMLWAGEYVSGISFLFNHSDYYFVIFILLCFYGMNQNGIINAVLSGNKLYPQQQKATFLTACFNILLTLLFFMLVVKWNLWGSFHFYLPFFTVTVFFTLGCSWYLLRKNLAYGFSFRFLSLNEIKIFLGFSFIAYFANVLQYLSYKTDFWLVEKFLGKEILGNYALVFSLLRIFWVLPYSVSSVIVPYSIGDGLGHIIQRNNKIMRMLVATILLINIALLPFVDQVILLLYGEQFSVSAFIIKFLMIGVIPFTVSNIITAFFIARGKVIHNLIYTFLLLATTITGDILLIPPFGVKGICAASLLASCCACLYLILIYKQYTHSLLKKMFLVQRGDLEEIRQQIKTLFVRNR